MKLVDRFRRKKQDSSVLPAEVNQYYQSEQRERRGIAAMLGVITLVITLIVASGLFFGGRYAYRKIAHKDNKPAAVKTTGSNNGQIAAPTAGDFQESAVAPSPSQATPSPAPSSSSPTSPVPSPAASQTPPAALPRTGEEGE